MSIEAIPIVFKNPNDETRMFGLLIRPKDGNSNAATTVFPIAPVHNQQATTSLPSTSTTLPFAASESEVSKSPPPILEQQQKMDLSQGSELEDLNGIELNQLPAITTEDYHRYLEAPTCSQQPSCSQLSTSPDSGIQLDYSPGHDYSDMPTLIPVNQEPTDSRIDLQSMDLTEIANRIKNLPPEKFKKFSALINSEQTPPVTTTPKRKRQRDAPKKDTPPKRKREDDEERLREYRKRVQIAHSRRLKEVTNEVANQFGNVHLELGARDPVGLIWNLDWKKIGRPKTKQKRRRSRNDYAKLRANLLVESPLKLAESKKCDCLPTAPCVDSRCSSRRFCVECTQKSCQLHDLCQNRRLTNNIAIHQLQLFDTELKGRGIRTCVEIPKEAFICEYVGEVIKTSTYFKRTLLRDESQPRFGIHLTPGYVVDSTERGSLSRFFNHSCEPNCVMERWSCGGNFRLGIFALRLIREGEELTYDYNRFVRLEPDQKCCCGSLMCRGIISYQPDVKVNDRSDAKELEAARSKKLFLVRNLNAPTPRKHVNVNGELQEFLLSFFYNITLRAETQMRLPHQRITQLKLQIQRVMKTKKTEELITKFNDTLKVWFSSLTSQNKRDVESLKSHFLHLKKTRGLPPNIDKELARAWQEDRKRPAVKSTLNAQADLSYLNDDNNVPISAYDYDPREQKAKKNVDCVRCICGANEEEGEMVQCAKCDFWLHAECVEFNDGEFECDFCSARTPPVDVPLKTPPKIALKNCVYFRALQNARGIQVRINEAVYVEKIVNDDHKKWLKGGAKKKKISIPVEHKSYARRDLRHFRVDRLFVTPDGERFVFGCYYARPHETFCDSSRLFHRRELFWTPFFDTLPLNAVVGKCCVLDAETWRKGRPTRPRFAEADVFVCEFQIDKNQRTFTRIPAANHYYVTCAPERHELRRDFTPFFLTQRDDPKERVRAEAQKRLEKIVQNIN
ncbi:Histone-lysine N-methyltransferase [Aphelenchoides besseyi]|nr:Histone-lysine N-methyltransferase [Aphelenchoides besseyi]